MSSQIVAQTDCGCRSTSQDCSPQQIVGPQGNPGVDGADGTDGQNSFTETTSSFVQPASLGTVNIEVLNSDWATVGEPLFITTGGSYLVTAVPDSSHITVQNLGYAGNAAPTTVIASSSIVTPSGFKGNDGTSAAGDMLRANNLSDVLNAATSRNNLGLGSLAVLNTVNNGNWSGTDLAVGNGGTGASLAATALSNLGGQPLDTFLTSIATLGTAADKMIYTTGVDVAAEITTTAFGRSALTDANAIAARSRLGKLLPRYGCLASLTGADLNVAVSDNAVQCESGRYRIDKIIVENASVSLTTATLGVFNLAGGLGTAMASNQSLAALTTSFAYIDLTLAAYPPLFVVTDAVLYIRVGTAQGSPATADVFIMGWKFD